MSIYTKTSLKSVKKGDLVEIYLELQAKYIDLEMDVNDLKKQRVLDINRMMKGDEYKKENNKLKKEIKDNVIIIQMLQEQTGDLTEDLRKHKVAYNGASEERNEVKKENDKLKEEIDDLKYDMENELYTEDQVEILREEWIGCENKELRKEIVEMKEHLKHSEDKVCELTHEIMSR